jgi:FkbM family methyltransferase
MRVFELSLLNRARGVAQTLDYVLRGHPLSSRKKTASLRRWLQWQLGSRILPGSVAFPFVGSTRLLVHPGLTGATGNIYCGLHEFEEMAFLLHLLGERDLFVDVGANIGSYTVLASGVRRAQSISLEPAPATFAVLLDNLRLNGLDALSEAHNCALGARAGSLRFTTDLDTVNHVATDQDSSSATVEVPVATMDAIVGDRVPVLIKIDVEGYEQEVLRGAGRALSNSSLLGVIMEINGSGSRYGSSDEELHSHMAQAGFEPFTYLPFERRLLAQGPPREIGNTLYLKNVPEVERRIQEAPPFEVFGLRI